MIDLPMIALMGANTGRCPGPGWVEPFRLTDEQLARSQRGGWDPLDWRWVFLAPTEQAAA